MDRVIEACDIFRESFQPSKPIKPVDPSKLGKLPKEWRVFYDTFGVAKRKDGFIWIVDPSDYDWLGQLFALDVMPVARNSFGDFFCLNEQGRLFSFLPEYRQLDELSNHTLMSIVTLSEKELTDDTTLLRSHKAEVKAGNITDYDTCYCLKPIIPLGGSETTSQIYLGDIKAYLELIAQST